MFWRISLTWFDPNSLQYKLTHTHTHTDLSLVSTTKLRWLRRLTNIVDKPLSTTTGGWTRLLLNLGPYPMFMVTCLIKFVQRTFQSVVHSMTVSIKSGSSHWSRNSSVSRTIMNAKHSNQAILTSAAYPAKRIPGPTPNVNSWRADLPICMGFGPTATESSKPALSS